LPQKYFKELGIYVNHLFFFIKLSLVILIYFYRQPWKGCLLFGPPGTGKSLLAKAVAGFQQCAFFNCSSSSLVSKWRGETEKIIRCLFDVARSYAPSVIFIDEVDALISIRNSESEHEASRRLKNEFFSQFDGMNSFVGSPPVMVLGATNVPWDLDEAARRRFEKRIYIPLPTLADRLEQIKHLFKNLHVDENVSPESVAALIDGSMLYSGADIQVLCREAAMAPVRRLLLEKSPEDIMKLRSNGALQVPPMTLDDFRSALSTTKPSIDSDSIPKYEAWNHQFGSSRI
jgi:katanin p60 ATPase-containing subunit A1